MTIIAPGATQSAPVTLKRSGPVAIWCNSAAGGAIIPEFAQESGGSYAPLLNPTTGQPWVIASAAAGWAHIANPPTPWLRLTQANSIGSVRSFAVLDVRA